MNEGQGSWVVDEVYESIHQREQRLAKERVQAKRKERRDKALMLEELAELAMF